MVTSGITGLCLDGSLRGSGHDVRQKRVRPTRDGITEVWHTRLGLREGTNVNENSLPTVRGVWSRDIDPGGAFRIWRGAARGFLVPAPRSASYPR
jgi:hypothetical protein